MLVRSNVVVGTPGTSPIWWSLGQQKMLTVPGTASSRHSSRIVFVDIFSLEVPSVSPKTAAKNPRHDCTSRKTSPCKDYLNSDKSTVKCSRRSLTYQADPVVSRRPFIVPLADPLVTLRMATLR